MDHEHATDCKGQVVLPGDYVSFKMYPRGTSRGTVFVSDRVKCVGRDGVERPALMIRSDEGDVFGMPGPRSLRKLASQSKPGA